MRPFSDISPFISTTFISIHAPFNRVRPRSRCFIALKIRFQFTHPIQSATRHIKNSIRVTSISIHAPIQGCDSKLKPISASFAVSSLIHRYIDISFCLMFLSKLTDKRFYAFCIFLQVRISRHFSVSFRSAFSKTYAGR